RLTGERGQLAEGSIPGTALCRDLVVLIQRASFHAPLPLDGLGGGAWDLHEAAAAIGVSVRTLQRWRDLGLVLQHVTFADGQSRLAVTHASLTRFRDQQPERFLKATQFSRMDSDEQDQFASATRELIERGASPNQAALQVAAASSRSHETIRQLMRRRKGERGPVQGAGGRITSMERRMVLGAWDRGLDPQLVADRLGRSRTAVRRIAGEARAERLRRHRPVWLHLSAFDKPEAERVILEADQVVIGPEPLSEEVDPMSAILELGAEDSDLLEPLLLPAMHLQRCVSARMIDTLPRTPSVARLDLIETGLRRADALRVRIGRAVLGAALGRLEQVEGVALDRRSTDDQAARIAFCIEVVDHMLDAFDPRARGELEPRLDRRIALETDKRIALRQRRGESNFAAGTGRMVRGCDMLAALEPMRSVLGLAPHLCRRLDRLSPQDQQLLRSRYGLGGHRPQTVEELAREAGESTRRISARLQYSIHALHGIAET
ncbi:MAG: sigma factor-like helix-turn-helix DNA-binding protein, partial [Planctomycetota bacterium]|nr:sigma factor-like helix-turn-helix DNA-binding protein [Planctomycetota bacterium]